MLVVTGANGFLGSYVVCQLLKAGYQVKGLKRVNSELDEFNMISNIELGNEKARLIKQFHWETADITNVLSLDIAFQEAEMVFHCAAHISFNQDWSELLKVNAEGTANVVNACLKSNVKKLIYASSTAAIGRTDTDAEIDEESVWVDDRNNTYYAESKHLAELEVWRGIEEGLNAVIVNPGIILGSGLWQKGSCRLFYNIYKGLQFYTKGINGFVGVRDVADAMLLLAFGNYKNQRYLLIGENRTYQSVFEVMAKGLAKKSPAIEVKMKYVPWISWILKLNTCFNSSSHLSAETLRTSVKTHRYNNQKISRLGFKFQAIDEVISESALQFLKNESV